MAVRCRIFINYRQSDTGDAASFLDHVLTPVFGEESVFKASRSIGAGAVFPPEIERAMGETAVALVLVGPHWTDEQRLFEPGDWVCREIAYFLEAGVPVIPVLLGGVRRVPDTGELPRELAGLAERQTVYFRARHTAHDIPGLVRVLREVAPQLAVRHFPRPAPQPRADRLPSSLLRPEYEVVPFRGREEELGRLTRWRDSTPALAVEVVVGAAGQGKSRLAVEFCRRSRTEGWAAGEPVEGTRNEDLVRLSEAGVPVVVVVDRVESQAESVADLLSAMAVRAAGAAAVRVMLLARSAGAWSNVLLERGSDAVAALLVGEQPLELGRLESEGEMERAAVCFAERLGVTWRAAGRPPVTSQTPSQERASGPRKVGDRVLDLHAAALDAVLTASGLASAGASLDPVVRLLHHEWRDWKRSAVAAELPDPHRERLAAVVAVATMYGGRSERAAYKALAVQLTFRQEQMHVVRRYLRWVARLYPPAGQTAGVAAPYALRPDRLGEEHVALTVLEQPELVRGVAAELDVEHRERALLVLGRAAPRHPQLVECMAELIESDPVGMVVPAVWAAVRLEQPGAVIGSLVAAVGAHRDLSVARSVLEVVPLRGEFAGLRVAAARAVLSAEWVRASPDTATVAETTYQLALALVLAADHGEALRAARAATDAYDALPPEPERRQVSAILRPVRGTARMRAATLLTYCLAVNGDHEEARRTARRAREHLRTWTPEGTFDDLAVNGFRYGLNLDEGKLAAALESYLVNGESAVGHLLGPLTKPAALSHADAMLGWVLDGPQPLGAADVVPIPPDLSASAGPALSPAREAAEVGIRAARAEISANIRDVFAAFADDPVTPVPFTDVVAATQEAGIHRWHVTAGTLRVIAVAVGELRALYWDPVSAYWVLDRLDVDAYGEFSGVGGVGSPLGGAGAGARELVERAME